VHGLWDGRFGTRKPAREVEGDRWTRQTCREDAMESWEMARVSSLGMLCSDHRDI